MLALRGANMMEPAKIPMEIEVSPADILQPLRKCLLELWQGPKLGQ